jgi:phosphoribosylformimino-5-aminoimidazole carboxamide ribotide isomerase
VIIIPAIDLMEGEVVRLYQGRAEEKTRYTHLGDPLEVAERWMNEGAEYLHIIDLDAALGRGENRDTIKQILSSVDLGIQVGGGIRSLDVARNMLESDVERIILGSLALSNVTDLEILLNDYGGGRVVVSLDYSDNTVLTRGWREETELTLESAFNYFLDLGVEWFLTTSTDRDGTLMGPDIQGLQRLTGRDGNIIAAGGIGSLKNLVELECIGVDAVVIGKALYEGRFTLKEAISEVSD